MASLVSLGHELRVVKDELDEKVYQCKREQIDKNFSDFNEGDLVLEDAIKDAASTFEVVRNETKSIRSLKHQLHEVKMAMGNEVTKSHDQLKTALSKMKMTDSCSPSVHKFNGIMLEKKIEGAEMQLEMGLKKLRKIEVYEKELDTATADLLSVLSTYQQRCVDRIVKSPAPPALSNQDAEASLPTKQSAQVHVIIESIRRLREENEMLKADLESIANSSASDNNQESLMVQELENEVSQLKLRLFEMQNQEMEREKIVAKDSPEEVNEDDTAETESEKQDEEEAGIEIQTESEKEEEEPEVEIEIQKSFMIDINQAANDASVDPMDEEDSYGFEDMSPSPVPMPKPVVDMEDQLAELELHDMGDIKLVQPDYEQLVMDQMRHEEELEEYAVKLLGLKETISELEDENRELKGQIAFAEGEDASAEEIQQLESEVAMWRLKYEESASGSSQVHRLRVELERTKAKSKKRITILQEDLQTLQKQGSDRIKNLIQKFKAFQEEGAARVHTLEVELEKSRAEVEQLKNRHDDEEEAEAEAETDSPEPIFEDESEDSEVDEPEIDEVTSQSPECAGEDAADGVFDESEQICSAESAGDKSVGQVDDEAGELREQLEEMKKSMEEAEARANFEMKKLQDTIASMEAERDMKQEVISSLHEQLDTAETAVMQKTKSMHFPTMYSFGSSPYDSDDSWY
mmetsp:Transcript_29478/g.70862  ORF Transcript_29478/g.70862 Transcript_29478/m.70862 type:complete len:691 (-) Transcript_29478:478-2550(-)|eukprot:CAMPEP_0113627680 /NCGR_PEP_ID=MMETSP0017_2-20120614/14338_1 /TAXON_ID=2856 /ORGANISM="Cylindrotheca closterium" /LENGTH=690 /DNA_ID=CAMNT_0000537949 /DNA_START=77 /DNA_END=2149 /DNA_ORIENTATION=+ /assembly_acc=CAM_ASM_000147